MDNNEAERQYRQADTTKKRSFDEIAKGFAAGTTSREQVLKGLAGTLLGGGLLAVAAGVAGAQANQSSGGSAVGGGGRRRKDRNGAGSGGDGGGGGAVCPPTCPGGSLTVAPTAQGECRCVAVSPGLKDPAFACGGRVNANGEGCCVCLFTVEGEGFCAVNARCDVITTPSVTECTSSGQCPSGRKCVFRSASIVDTLPAGGVCWPECHTTDGVDRL